MAMILNLGTSNQDATFTSEIAAESFRETLLDVKSDLGKNGTYCPNSEQSSLTLDR